MTSTAVFVVDDDADVRDSVRALLESAGFDVQDFKSAKEFLMNFTPRPGCCLVADIRMPEMDGLELQERVAAVAPGFPVIIMTGHGDVPLAVRAMKAGALDFIEKPFDDERLINSIEKAFEISNKSHAAADKVDSAQKRLAELTDREREVLSLLVAGHPNKIVAYKLDISPRTVEVHRGHLMSKLQARSLADLVRIALAAQLPIADR